MVNRSLVIAATVSGLLATTTNVSAIGCLRDQVGGGMAFSCDGSCHTASDDDSGAANAPQTRPVDPTTSKYLNSYVDGHKQMKAPVIGARDASLMFSHRDPDTVDTNRKNLNALWIYFGQFIDHDITLVHEQGANGETADISVSPNDPVFSSPLSFHRSDYTSLANDKPVEYKNAISSFLDLDSVYGNNCERREKLRAHEGGLLLTKDGYMPLNKEVQIDMAGSGFQTAEDYFACGDVRCNENVILLSLHETFVREHNRQAGILARLFKTASDEQLFQLARVVNTIQYQMIVWDEWLPQLIGHKNMEMYMPEPEDASEAESDVSMSLWYSTVVFRFGHSIIPEHVSKVDKTGVVREKKHLHEVFFAPNEFKGDAHFLLNGAKVSSAGEADPFVTESLQHKLFLQHTGGADLVAKNLQRARDHGIVGINEYRELLGLAPFENWSEVTSNTELSSKFEAVYGSGSDAINNADPWLVGMAEDPFNDALLGETFTMASIEQFGKFKKYDMFHYENFIEICQPFCDTLLERLMHPSLWTVIAKNFPDMTFPGKLGSFHTQPVYASVVGQQTATIRWNVERHSYDRDFMVYVYPAQGNTPLRSIVVPASDDFVDLDNLTSGTTYRIAVHYTRLANGNPGREIGEVSISTV